MKTDEHGENYLRLHKIFMMIFCGNCRENLRERQRKHIKRIKSARLVCEISVVISRSAFQTMNINQNTGGIVHKKNLKMKYSMSHYSEQLKT